MSQITYPRADCWLWLRCVPLLLTCIGGSLVIPARAGQRLDASLPPRGGLTCRSTPALANALLLEGRRLGIAVLVGQPEMPGQDASYRAEHGRLGTITLSPRPMTAEVRCLLISHEFIHVLQHLHGQLNGVIPLGWGVSSEQRLRFGSPQEAEAYAHQNSAAHVLHLLRQAARAKAARPSSLATDRPFR